VAYGRRERVDGLSCGLPRGFRRGAIARPRAIARVMTATLVPASNTQRPDLREIAVALFDELKSATGDGVGVTRECFAEGENRAFEIVTREAKAQGLKPQLDALSNLVVMMPDDDGSSPAFYIGSHIDSVPQGGNFDGAAGVIAGLLCLTRMHAEGRRTARPVRVLCMRGEESAFYGRANIGSRALFGLIDDKDLSAKSQASGRTLAEAMAANGVPVERVASREPFFKASDAKGYLELHIEQGPVMVAREFPTAVVTGIRGNIRHRKVICHGEAGHSGTVPRWLRHDAVFAFADLVSRLDEHWQALQERGLDLVITTGIVSTNSAEHAISKIPGEIAFSFEVRSQNHDTLEAFYELFRSECRAVAQQRGVKFVFDERVYTEPARMDEGLIKSLLDASGRLGLPKERIPSGAGHDAAVFANAGVPSGMIFIRNANGSHNPEESMEIDDFIKGVDLLYETLSEIA
jgi:beta-ureidopropionase / N-carbamoyl-L-amino-acid hydrolase